MSNTPSISPEEKHEREKALGLRPASSTTTIRVVDLSTIDTNRRWLDNGDIIEFTSIIKSCGSNAEFAINNDPNHRIWLSQLRGAYLNPNNLDISIWPDITFKDGTEIIIDYKIGYDRFWAIVKGKKFRVEIEIDSLVKINERNEQVRKLGSVDAIVSYIDENLSNHKYSAVIGMTKKATLYSFIEV